MISYFSQNFIKNLENISIWVSLVKLTLAPANMLLSNFKTPCVRAFSHDLVEKQALETFLR